MLVVFDEAAAGGQEEVSAGGGGHRRTQARADTRGRGRETMNKAAGPSRPVPRSYRRAWRCAQAHDPGTGAYQAAKVCGGAGEGGRRCVRGLNREEMDHNEPGPSRCSPPPGAAGPHIAGYSDASVCGRRWVGWGRLAVAESPASCPHLPPAPARAPSPPKRRRGGAPGLRLQLSPRTGARGRGG